MKKLILFIAALSLLAVSCRKSESVVAEDCYQFNLSVKGGGFTRADATVGWTEGESVFVFFRPEGGEILGRCLTLVWNGSSFSQSGSGIPYGSLGQGGVLAALYVPYLKSGVKPVYKDGNWTIDCGDVYYSCATGVEYSVDGADVSANVNMSIPDGFVQFAVDASVADDGDVLECNIVDAFEFAGLGSDFTFSEAVAGDGKMTGRKDGGKVYFCGKINSVTADECQWTLYTATENYRKSVASALVEKNHSYNLKDFIPSSALSGLFSISATEKVRFSKGNLYCIRSGSEGAYSYSFAFEDQQYYFRTRYGLEDETAYLSGGVENTPANTSGLFQYISPTIRVGNPEFTDEYDPAKYQVAIASNGAFSDLDRDENNDYQSKMSDYIDYGSAMGPQWHLMTDSEWNYILHSYGSNWRPNAENLRKLSTVCGVYGAVLAPDDWDLTASPLQDSYDAAAWIQAEEAGLVFLPAAGYVDSNYQYHSNNVDYWTGANEGWTTAYDVHFQSNGSINMYGNSRILKQAVRLVYR